MEKIGELKYNEEEIRACYKFLNHLNETEIRLIHPQKSRNPQSVFVHSEEEFVEACKKYNGEFNVYAGINEREEGGKNKSNVISVQTVVLDIDAKREKGFEKEPATQEELNKAETIANKILATIKKSGQPLPVKLCSGNGYQLWFAIPKILIDENNRQQVEEKLQLFQDKMIEMFDEDNAIDKIGDLPRIIKVWGTLNIKSGKGVETPERPYRIATVVSEEKTRIENPHLKERILELEKQKDEFERTEVDNFELVSFPPCVMNLLVYENKDGKYWYRIIQFLASYCYSIGISTDACKKIIYDWNRKQIYHEEGEDAEIEQIVARIYKNKINVPNCKKIKSEDGGFPYFGLKDLKLCKPDTKCSKCISPVVRFKRAEDEHIEKKILSGEKRITYEELRKEVNLDLSVKRFQQASELIVNYIEENNHIYTTKDDLKTEMWIYQDGIYKPNGKSTIRELCRELLQEAYNHFVVNIVISKVEADTYIEAKELFENRHKEEIPVENGILNVLTRELSPFTPEKIFLNKLPVKYNPEAKSIHIDKFFKDVLGNEEDILVMYELIGSGLYRDYFTEKAMMMLGSGRNGKSKAIELIKRLVGMENCSNISINSMREESFSLSELYGKLFNLAGDLSGGDLKDTGVFKQTIGRDILQTKRKFLRDLYFVNYAKHIFSTNELPRVFDISDGFWTKWVLLSFPYQFLTQEEINKLPEAEKANKKIKDPDIIEKISTPEELSGLLNNALDGLDRLLKQKNFSQTKGTVEIKNFWIRNSDSFTAFCMDYIEQDNFGFISKKDLRRKFNLYCKKFHLKGTSDKNIKAILEDRYGAIDDRKLMNGEQVYIWDGIKFKEKEKQEKIEEK